MGPQPSRPKSVFWQRLAAAATLGTLALLIFALWVGPAGCGARVIPPTLGPGDVPATVHIVDYGYHASLAVPRCEDVLSEWAYGQWDWFALGRTDWYRAPVILLFPSRGALGTRDVPVFADMDRTVEQFAALRVHSLEVSQASVDALLVQLDERYRTPDEPRVTNPETGLTFAPDPSRYWLFNNCNTELAQWLRALDCQVHGLAILAQFRVDPPAGNAPSEDRKAQSARTTD